MRLEAERGQVLGELQRALNPAAARRWEVERDEKDFHRTTRSYPDEARAANASRAAATVASITGSVCAVDTNQVSNCDGGR